MKSVRTFSKTELEDLCARTGLICNRFYYPYPDYKFPYEIFTDESVNTPLYGRPMFQFSEGKLALFYEAGLCQTLAKEKGYWPECSSCSWRDMVLGNGSQEVAACMFPRVREILMEGKT